MSANNTLLNMLKDMAKGNPELQKLISESLGYDKASEAREEIKELTHKMVGEGGYTQAQIAYGLTVNLVLLTYIAQWGDRAKARDQLAEAIDKAMNGIDIDARKNGLYNALQEYAKAERAGDKAAIERIKEKQRSGGHTFGFEY